MKRPMTTVSNSGGKAARMLLAATLLATVPAWAVNKCKRPDALALLRSQQQGLQAEGEAGAASILGALVDHMESMIGEGMDGTLQQATATVSLNAALLQNAPPGKEEAMRSWLGFATEGEIAQEMLALPPEKLDALLRLNTPAKPARRGGASKGKKKPKKGD